MDKYVFDPIRFLKGRARAARAMRNFEDEKNFNECADYIEELKKLVQGPWKCDICGNYVNWDSYDGDNT